MSVAVYAGFAAALAVIVRLAIVCRATVTEKRHSDPLTGLLNRQGFEVVVSEHLKRETPFAIAWAGLDGFRKINELRGYANGDVLLKQVAPRIRRLLRPGDAVARFGGDQFLILIQGNNADSAVAGRIPGAIDATAGVSLYPGHGDNAPDLLRCAEAAMRQAKASARGRTIVYQPFMATEGFRGAEIAHLIESALANDRFRLVYQPIVDEDAEIVRMEALVRIDDPALGRVTPAEFIDVAEQTGLIHKVGAWIVRNACRQAREWHEAGYRAQITINLSPRQITSSAQARDIMSEIFASGADVSAVTMHITGPVESPEPVELLRGAGIHVSSQWSEACPLFDGIRVRAPFYVPDDAEELTVVAQGIEEPEQLDRAREAGCTLFQGYLIAPPLDPRDAAEVLRAGLLTGAGSLVRG